MQEKGGDDQEPQRVARDSGMMKGSEREQEPYHIHALKIKCYVRRRSNDMGGFGEWRTWGRAREGSVRPEMEGTSRNNTLLTVWYF